MRASTHADESLVDRQDCQRVDLPVGVGQVGPAWSVAYLQHQSRLVNMDLAG
jgi:hypothetical protein